MSAVLRQAWALLLGMLLLMTANSLQGTLLGVRGSIEAIDTTTMGYIMSGYFAGFLGGSRVVPPLLRRVGHIRVYAALGTSLSVAFLLFAVRVDALSWLLLRGVVGFCYSGLYIVTESWLNELSDNRTRGQAMSLNMLVQMLAAVAGQWLVNAADPGGYALFVLISVIVSLSFLPILLTVSTTPAHETARPMSVRELVALSPLACVGMLLLGTVFATMYGMVAVYATAAGFGVADTARLVMAISLGAILTQYPIGWLSDRFDRRRLVLVLTAVGSLAAGIGAFVADGFGTLFLVIFLIGGTTTPAYALLIADANDRIERDQMAAASAGLLLIAGIGAMSGPVVAGYALNAFGDIGFFLFPAALLAATTLYGVTRTRRTASVETRGRTAYVPLTSTSSVAGTALAYGRETLDEPAGGTGPVPDARERPRPTLAHEPDERPGLAHVSGSIAGSIAAADPGRTPPHESPSDMPVSQRGSPDASTYDVMLIQEGLKVAGLYAGPIDGIAGAKTMIGVRAWKRRHALPVDGTLDAALLASMREAI